MTDSDFNFIKPVDNLHNVQSLTPAQQREERKRRQRPQPKSPQQQEPKEQPVDEPPREQASDRNDSPHEIDYRA